MIYRTAENNEYEEFLFLCGEKLTNEGQKKGEPLNQCQHLILKALRQAWTNMGYQLKI